MRPWKILADKFFVEYRASKVGLLVLKQPQQSKKVSAACGQAALPSYNDGENLSLSLIKVEIKDER